MQTGLNGESLAAEYLINKGYEIVARNYRYGRAEIDLIVRKGNWLVFVEVKTRANDKFGFPEEFVDRKKEENILYAAENYIYANDSQELIRYDVVSILGKDIVHLEDAFY
jgi:putative endonuclease